MVEALRDAALHLRRLGGIDGVPTDRQLLQLWQVLKLPIAELHPGWPDSVYVISCGDSIHLHGRLHVNGDGWRLRWRAVTALMLADWHLCGPRAYWLRAGHPFMRDVDTRDTLVLAGLLLCTHLTADQPVLARDAVDQLALTLQVPTDFVREWREGVWQVFESGVRDLKRLVSLWVVHEARPSYASWGSYVRPTRADC